jgi:RNA polymerase sigma-70 factor (ECF subfamily)
VNEDVALAERLRSGDHDAFREIVEKHKKKVYCLALDIVGNHHDAEDVSQEVFLKVYRSFETFKKEAKLGSWIYRITYNAGIDCLRRKTSHFERMKGKAMEEKSLPDFSNPRDVASQEERAGDARLLQKRIDSALRNISDKERAVFVMRHYNDLKLGDIAEVMGVSVGSVKSYLFRALKKLQKELSPLMRDFNTEA